MKINIYYYIASMIICFSFLLVKGQDAYYYYDNSRIILFEDKKSIVLVFNENATHKNRAERFENDTLITEMDVSCGNEDIYFARLSYISEQNDILLKLTEYDIDTSDLESYSYGYLTYEGINYWATNEVIIKKHPQYKVAPDSVLLSVVLDKYNAIYFESDNYGVDFYKVASTKDAIDLSAELYESGMVEFAEPDFSSKMFLFNDPLFPEQFYLHNIGQTIDGFNGVAGIDIDVLDAWNSYFPAEEQPGNPNIRVAVIDDGIDLDPLHLDMHFVSGGYTPTPPCLSNCDGRARDNGAHGQVVAGIIAAEHNNKGIKGVAPGIRLIPFRIVKWNGKFFKAKYVGNTINNAWDNFECDVMNCSWGYGYSSFIRNAITNAAVHGRNGKGCVIVFAAGNYDAEHPTKPVVFPAFLLNVIAVGAIDLNGNHFDYSARGSQIDLVTPSGQIGGNGNIRTTDRMGEFGYTNGNYYNNFGGTSAAAPQVAGVAALLLSRDPNLTREEVYCKLVTTAKDLGSSGKDDEYGYGLVSAYRALSFHFMHLKNKNFGGLQDFWASNTITSEGTIIEQGADVTLRSGNQIRVTSGRAKAGSTFRAYIDACDPCAGGGTMMLASNNSFSHNQANANFNISDSELPEIEKDQNQVSETEQLVYAYEFSAFPNPFDNSTTISFSHNKTSRVKIYLTNSYGKEVMQLHNKYTAPGNYEIKIDGNRLQPGIYFCVIETESSRETIKIVKM